MQESQEEVDLTGITYHDLSIEEHLARQPREGTGAVYAEEIAEKKKAIYHEAKGRQEEETKRVSRRVVHLSANKIREDYGIMQKPYKTLTENILWVIVDRGPVTVKAIQDELEKSYNLSGTMAEIWKRCGRDGMLIRSRKGRSAKKGEEKGYRYRLGRIETDGWSNERMIEVLYEKYLSEAPGKKSKGKPIGEVLDELVEMELKECEDLPTEAERQVQGLKEKRAANVLTEVLSQALGVEVKVTGRIEIVFGFAGGEGKK